MNKPILIIGAGISGLTTAQALRKEGIPFRVFERDSSPSFKSAGWGLTLNWALPTFRALLPDDIVARLPETFVDAEAVKAGEKGSFTFYDLSTGEALWKVPASERIRVSRERLRRLLLTGLDVEWNKTIGEITKGDADVTAHFLDGNTAKGSFLVACDGARSTVRRWMHPAACDNYQLPVRFVGASAEFSEFQIRHIRELDQYFLQGSDPRTDAYLWFSFLEAPGDPGCPEVRNGERMYRCQVCVSWPYRQGFFGNVEPISTPLTSIGQISWIKALSTDWAEPFRSVLQNVPNNAEIKAVELIDWVPRKRASEFDDWRVVLLGDAMHAMVMYRGEGANHAIVDVSVLLEVLKPLYGDLDLDDMETDQTFRAAVGRYEDEVVSRTETAVLASRQACLDAHDFSRLDDSSPLIRRRVMRTDLEKLAK
ncbi:hypothetical protein CKM354_000834200 [Cercospora kikuchii]|uniref:FAD-binding domain-containing protein n=1 Tax=Cercospora kikuchii TaxID=84275 RepID=A0A9P3CM23_9PEZI|nr:uncharacterized protein CKM354_000834200 [Cercospora kikuchii]GIZ45161.1 hypothetical protein CKM354_000834200 [Cercospora kikuchii]